MSRKIKHVSADSFAVADTTSVSLAAAGTAAHAARADVPSAAKPAVADISSPVKRPHFLDAAERSDQAGQLRAINLYKSYRKAAVKVPVLRGVSFKVRAGELLAIVGQSGSGKSTLLHLLGTLDAPDKGEVHYAGQRIDDLPARGRDHLRNRRFGMIFQFYHLLPELTTLENVLSPLMIAHGAWSYFRHRSEHRARAEQLLEMVGLSHRLKHRPRELSGGEMQRAAIARALIAQPDLLLADEPTGNLDQATGRDIIQILRTLNRQQNLTIVMVTHDRAIADQADRIVRLAGGRIDE
ncbi:MAG: ABC transporter ATP-binding protein [Thermoguttaceae bacterium]